MKLYGIDIETYDPHLTTKGASWVYDEGEIIVTGVYSARLRTAHAYKGNGGKTVKSLLLDPKVTLVGTNIIYDLGWLCYEHNLKAKDVKCSLVDIAIAEAFIDEYQPFSLDTLAWKYLREHKGAEQLKVIAEAQGLCGDFRRHLKVLWDKGFQKEICEYVTSDADQPVRIWEKQSEILAGNYNYNGECFKDCMDAVVTNFKLIKIVLGMKQRGVRIDMAKRKKNYEILKNAQDKLRVVFESKYGRVNFNSPKQLSELFDRQRVPYFCKIRIKGYRAENGTKFAKADCFVGSDLWEQRKKLKPTFTGIRVDGDQLILRVPKYYAGRTNNQLIALGYETTCNPSIDKKALEALKKTHEVARDIVDLKQATSIIDKFLGPKFDRFIVKHGENDYRIHADFNIIGARKTGRFSSANPNLQQVPSNKKLFADTENEIKLGTLCREIIIPNEGYLLGKCDYAGQENRLMAHYALGKGSDEIRRKYNENPDFDEHQWVADTATSVTGTKLERKEAKAVKFGLGYGMQITSMCANNGWAREQGQKIWDAYHETVPFVQITMDKVSEVIASRGYIKTLGGRHCHLKKYDGKPDKRSAYKGFNKLIQGSAADMTKRAMVMLDEKGLFDIFPLYLTVHDEIDFGIPKNAAAIKRLPEIQNIMENTFPLSVPIRVDPEVGVDWGHVKGREEKKKKKDGTIVEVVLTMGQFITKIIKEVKAA